MASENEGIYALCVVFAKTTLSFPTRSLGLYVEIGLDGSTARHTSVIERDTTLFWDGLFCIYSNTSSAISLWIKDESQTCGNSCIGHISIDLGTLLNACSEDGCMYDRDVI